MKRDDLLKKIVKELESLEASLTNEFPNLKKISTIRIEENHLDWGSILIIDFIFKELWNEIDYGFNVEFEIMNDQSIKSILMHASGGIIKEDFIEKSSNNTVIQIQNILDSYKLLIPDLIIEYSNKNGL